MIQLIAGLPASVLGLEATGMITDADYRDIVMPQAAARIGHGPIRMLYVLRSNLDDFKFAAIWDDTVFGVAHWHDFSEIAIVTDHLAIRSIVGLFRPFFPAQVRMFSLAGLQAAKDWISAMP